MGKPFAFPTLVLIVALMLVPMAIAVDHVVGDIDYDGWIAGKSFVLGDALLFNYDVSHTVDVVDKDGYDNCDARESMTSFQDGNTTVLLNRTGPTYVICATTGHCLGGMKLSLTVQSPAPPPETSSPPLPSTFSTPSPSPSTASTPFPANRLVPPPLLAPTNNGGSKKLNNVLGFVFVAIWLSLNFLNSSF